MQKTEIVLPELKLVGLSCRTKLEHEMSPNSAKISGVLEKYFGNLISAQISHRLTPGVTYCVYHNYESDYTGEYDYFVGEIVSSFENVSESFSRLTIPTQHYVKITAGPGQMPQVCIQTWQKIWESEISPKTLGGERNYNADFEVYDERALDPKNTTLDIYVGIKK